MSTIGKRVIYAGGEQDSKPLHVEGKAVAAIAPGTVLKQTAAGLDVNDVAKTAFGQQFVVADKDFLRQKSVDDAWIINENMVAIIPRSGEFINVLVATGQTLIKGTGLTRNGAGLLIVAATTSLENIVAYADEAVTTTATQLVRVTAA